MEGNLSNFIRDLSLVEIIIIASLALSIPTIFLIVRRGLRQKKQLADLYLTPSGERIVPCQWQKAPRQDGIMPGDYYYYLQSPGGSNRHVKRKRFQVQCRSIMGVVDQTSGDSVAWQDLGFYHAIDTEDAVKLAYLINYEPFPEIQAYRALPAE